MNVMLRGATASHERYSGYKQRRISGGAKSRHPAPGSRRQPDPQGKAARLTRD
jgi:hypothetical protein